MELMLHRLNPQTLPVPAECVYTNSKIYAQSTSKGSPKLSNSTMEKQMFEDSTGHESPLSHINSPQMCQGFP